MNEQVGYDENEIIEFGRTYSELYPADLGLDKNGE